ncbi:MAG: hypothetical protein ACI9WU_004698, partial [Myxococcota bacterium]
MARRDGPAGSGAVTDDVMLAPLAWLNELKPLEAHRERLGHRVQRIAVESVYDRFSHGQPDAGALDRFVEALQQKTGGTRQLVLLAGPAQSHWRGMNSTTMTVPPASL